MSMFVGIILLAGAFAGGFLVGHLVPSSNQLPFLNDLIPSAPTITPEEQAATPNELKTLFAPFWEAWNIVHEEYVDQPLDDVALMRGAIRGMMDALGDKHTTYMDPEVYEAQQSSLQGREYEGIGAYVDTDGEYLTIISPISGSPADLAGLRPGDKIIAIDGEDMTGVDPDEARLKVLGPAGTTVNLTIQREGEPEPLEIPIIRANIIEISAEGKMLDNGIAYVDINTFGDKTTPELRSTLDTMLAENPRGIIIDLRNNGGGYLHTAVEVASEFIAEGVVLYEQYGDGHRDVYEASGDGQATDLPIVVLMNEGSASASEILAGALQDYGLAKLVGVQSYGKGSVQIWFPLSNDQGAARVTIAKWLTPKERTIADIGLTPDVIVECDDCAFSNDTDNDVQVQAAIETLLAMINNSPLPTSMPTSIPTPVQ
ncbi:MAG TPA: S41 family peptidase [Anaerolineales bacterium]|nr:S41 family peptidase [Anaerolineales bacterium]